MKALVLVFAAAACVDTTGGHHVTYDVAARGTGNTLDVNGWHIVLVKANVFVGAVYLNLAVANSGSVTQGTDCVLPGIYTGEDLAPLTVDVLSTELQPFGLRGNGTDDEARTGEVWLTSGDVNALNDNTVVADIAGTATKGAQVIPFTSSITIGQNHAVHSTDAANPSAHPICKQRIVSPISIDFRPAQDGTLVLTIDPTLWFASVDFSTVPGGVFPDDNSIPASQNLFNGVRSPGAFSFAFQ